MTLSQLDEDQTNAWKRDATCRGMDPELFYPGRGVSTAEAKEICRGQCPVRWECFEAGIKEHFGVWGGFSERERRRLRRKFGTNDIPRVLAFVKSQVAKGLEPRTSGTVLGRHNSETVAHNNAFYDDDDEELVAAHVERMARQESIEEERRRAVEAFFEDSSGLG